jgi:coenzyme F420 biosynthesis associated uncharacterized protein
VTSSPLVDWGLAERAARMVAGEGGGRPGGYRAGEVAAAAVDAADVVGGYAGLGKVDDPPAGELIGRTAWTRGALETMAAAALPLERQAAERLSIGGPLGAVARRLAGAAAAAEAGVAAGYAARRVLAQYDLALFGEPRPARLVFVGENMDAARRELDARPSVFLRWVALHEAAHVIQFERVDWLAPHLRRLAAELIEAAALGLDTAALRRLAKDAVARPRETVLRVLRGELARVLADPRQRQILDRLQATMSVVEGHAEWVMDSAAPELGPDLRRLRERMDDRRTRRGGIGEAIGRMLGIDLKLRQYRLGKSFCDGVEREGGEDAVRAVWRSAEALPTLAELETPRLWLERASVPA